MTKPESPPPPPRFMMRQKAVAVKVTLGFTVATMTSVVVSVIAASLALGLLAALPMLRTH